MNRRNFGGPDPKTELSGAATLQFGIHERRSYQTNLPSRRIRSSGRRSTNFYFVRHQVTERNFVGLLACNWLPLVLRTKLRIFSARKNIFFALITWRHQKFWMRISFQQSQYLFRQDTTLAISLVRCNSILLILHGLVGGIDFELKTSNRPSRMQPTNQSPAIISRIIDHRLGPHHSGIEE